MSTPNGQKVQIMLEELHDVYGTEWTQTLMYAGASLSEIYHLPYVCLGIYMTNSNHLSVTS